MPGPCPSCGTQAGDADRFCASCGAPLLVACPTCSAEVHVTAKFCAACGGRLDRAAPVGEERKLVTVLFADLAGSTSLGEQLDPEQLRVLLKEYFGAAAEVLDRWGGVVEKFIGDAVVAVFGVPVSHEDDVHRALGAALDMRTRIEELNPAFEHRHGIRLAMRIGINTGDVIVANRGDLSVAGDVTNVAARLQQTAEPGEIIVGERSCRAARGAFRFEALPDRSLKGKEAPVPCRRLVERKELHEPRGLIGLSRRLVGRDRELELLRSLYRATVDERRPRLVAILGHAGVGKTRLGEEFLKEIGSGPDAAAVHRGRCLPYGSGITYWALREILWDLAGISLEDPAVVAAEKLSKLVRDRVAQIDGDDPAGERTIFALAASAGIGIAGSRFDRMTPESIGEELGLAWPGFVSSLARTRPIVLVLDDLHWAEPPLLDMVEHVVSRSTGPVFVLGTARPELVVSRPGWGARPNVSQLGLEPLAEQQARELIEEILPRTEPAFRERVLGAAEGNPFYAEEVVRHLVDRGILQKHEGELTQVDTSSDVSLPDTVRALLATRIDALPAEERRVLQGASVVGRVFWTEALETILPEGSVRPALRELEQKGLVVARSVSSAPGMSEHAFHHGLMREAAYQSIPRSIRARMHAAVADWIEELAGDRRLEFVDLIAHHYESAARPDDAKLAWPADEQRREELRTRAFAALLEAGDVARRRFASDQAIGFADRVLTLAATDIERILGLELKALAATAVVRPDVAWPAFLEAIALTRRDDVETRSRLRAHATLLWSRYGGAFPGTDWKPEAAEMVKDGLREAGEEAVSFEVGALLVGRASARYWRVLPMEVSAGFRDAERAVEIGRAIGGPLPSYAVDALYSLAAEEGFCRTLEIARLSVRTARESVDRIEAAELLVTATTGFCDAGHFEEAAMADEELRPAELLGPHRRLHALGARSGRLAAIGDLRELFEATRGCHELIEEDGGKACGWGARALAAQSLARFEAGDRGGAHASLDLLERAYSEPFRTPSPYMVLEYSAPLLGWNEIRRRAPEPEQDASAEARIWRLRVLMPAAAVTGDRIGLDGLVRDARELAGRACAPILGWLADWAEALSDAAGRDGRAADQLLAATSSIDRFGERYKAARLLLDALPFMRETVAREIAPELVGRFSSMAANESAVSARAFIST